MGPWEGRGPSSPLSLACLTPTCAKARHPNHHPSHFDAAMLAPPNHQICSMQRLGNRRIWSASSCRTETQRRLSMQGCLRLLAAPMSRCYYCTVVFFLRTLCASVVRRSRWSALGDI
ncbi:uncharacterized protein K444DRAFT_97208 [Hyaloscypha bicolor E]|uniref:Uncharacterized protein n=1 Tax=Hyaloscypha bicolor E TaxID=1095630 RepID=A0A2J6SWE1_9HELO|nr:uncharacterized protein K444DRAFT_97208 [Hyaloscypha bicolor E]PMD55095.1 hypothetical protein K444DRAFT_97208 [Hyaloscypha bicolor E]